MMNDPSIANKPVSSSAKQGRNPDDNSPAKGEKKTKAKDSGSSIDSDCCVSCGGVTTVNAVECKWCKKWDHKDCAKIGDNEYTLLGESSPNIIFICSVCLPNLSTALDVSNNNLKGYLKTFENQVSDAITSQISTSFNIMKSNLSQALNDISSKIDDLCSRCNSLHTEINIDLMDTSAQNSVSEPSFISALNIVHELADRERRKNLIVYNFPKSNDHAADKTAFLKLCSTIFHLNIDIT